MFYKTFSIAFVQTNLLEFIWPKCLLVNELTKFNNELIFCWMTLTGVTCDWKLWQFLHLHFELNFILLKKDSSLQKCKFKESHKLLGRSIQIFLKKKNTFLLIHKRKRNSVHRSLNAFIQKHNIIFFWQQENYIEK